LTFFDSLLESIGTFIKTTVVFMPFGYPIVFLSS
jgi:hypothetical protein